MSENQIPTSIRARRQEEPPKIDEVEPRGSGAGSRLLSEPPPTHGDDPDDERIVELLALGYTQEKVANETGVSSRTIRRRLQDPELAARVNHRKRELHAESWSQILGLRERASDVLAASLESAEERFRLQAARSVYDIGARIRREQVTEDLLDRVDQLERELARRQNSEKPW